MSNKATQANWWNLGRTLRQVVPMNTNTTRRAVRLAASAAALVAATGITQAEQTTKPGVGVNLAPVVDWSTSQTFVDLMRSSRKWIPQTSAAPNGTWDTGAWIDVDSNNWPKRLESGQAASTIMARDINGKYPAGTYTVLYEGEGVIEFAFDATVIHSEPGKMLLDVKPSDAGVFMSIKETNPSNYIRNVRVIMPGFEDNYDTQIFHPTFLESLSNFDNLRFMDWQVTNNSKVSNWSQRTDVNRSSMSAPDGVSIEIMVDLVNRLDKDAWFCMPHLADDEYVHNFAAKVAELIEPGRKVYIEHSNEVWNSQFKQYQYCSQQGQARGWGSAPWESAWLYHSHRSVQIFDIFDDYFGPDQLVRVMGSQAANWWITKLSLEHQDAWMKTDAVAIAPYFAGPAIDPNRFNEVVGWSVDRVLDTVQADLDVVMKWTDDHLKETSKYGIELIGYEGGQHLAAHTQQQRDSSAYVDLLIKANRHPRMRSIFREYLERWHERDVGPMVLYNHVSEFNKYGSWGLKEFHSDTLDEAPKYAGTLDFIQANGGGGSGAAGISDLNADGTKDNADIGLFMNYFRSSDLTADLNQDTILDNGDIVAFITDFEN